MRVLILAVALAAVAVALEAPPSASASDRSVKRAWDADDVEFARHGERVRALYRRWRRSGYTRKRPLIRELRATRATLDGTRARVRAERPSSETGAAAKYWALRSMAVFDTQLATEIRAVRARSAGERSRARRLFADAEALLERSLRYARRAKRLFGEALS